MRRIAIAGTIALLLLLGASPSAVAGPQLRLSKVAEVRRADRNTTLVLTDGTNVQVGPSYISAVETALGLA